MTTSDRPHKTPTAFINRRMHSLLGLWLVIYLFEHLLTNSEAALFVGYDGEGFIKMVNFIHSLPYLYIIESLFIGVPFGVHMVLGVKYLLTMKQNSYVVSDAEPKLPEYPRNHAYTWQRITSWILIPLILLHVFQMRFLKYPETVKVGETEYHMVKVNQDEGLNTLAPRIGITLFDPEKITSQKSGMRGVDAVERQEYQQKEDFSNSLKSFRLGPGDAVAVSESIGTAILMNVRETFKSPLMLILYSIFLSSAVFHACNGLWTFALTWGIPLSMTGQRIIKRFALGLMALLSFLGFAAIWGSYLINLRY